MKRYGVVLGAALLLGVVPIARAFTSQNEGRSVATSDRSCNARQDAVALLAKASSLMEQGSFQTAIDVLQRDSILQCQVEANLLLAGAYDALGNTSAEVQTLHRAQQRWPTNSSIGASLAHYYMSAGMLDSAAAAIQRCQITPKTPLRELQLMASVYLDNHNLVRAREAAKAAYAGYPSEETLLLLANVFQLQGRYLDVISLLGRVRAKYSSSSPFLVTSAESEYDAQIYQAALHDVSQAVKLDDTSYAAHYVRANTLVKTGDLEGAASEYERAIQLSPSQPRTYYRLALTQEMQQNTSAAQTSLAQAIAQDIHYAPAYSEIGKLLLRQNQYQQAVDQLTKAIQYNPRYEQAYFLLVQAYARLGQKEESAAVLSKWNQLKAAKTARPVTGRLKDLPTRAE